MTPTPFACKTLATAALALVLLTTAPAHPAGGELYPRIVNGTLTAQYPSAGALLILSRSTGGALSALCSGTMIGCRTFVTAAHCVCPENAPDAATCLRDGPTNPAELLVFLQHAGIFRIASVSVDPAYNLTVGGDAAVLHLADTVTGVSGVPINAIAPLPTSTLASIAGFGRTGGDPNTNVDAGTKRSGAVITATCPADVPADMYVCWNFFGSNSNTCQGDSGGPLLLDTGSGMLLAGIHSGGASDTCLAPDMGFDTSIFAEHEWIASEQVGDPPNISCGGLPAVGAPGASVVGAIGTLSTVQPEGSAEIVVAPGTTRLRVALNGQVFSLVGRTEVRNDFELSVAHERMPTTVDFDCRDNQPGPFAYCEFEAPPPGTWFAVASRVRGSGTYQITATTLRADPCRGDCGGQGVVTIDDLLKGVNIALDQAPLAECPESAAPGSDMVTVGDIILAVSNALDGCPAMPATHSGSRGERELGSSGE